MALCEPQLDLGPLGSHTRKATYLLVCSYTSTVSRPGQLSPSDWLPYTEPSGGNSDSHPDGPACFLRPRESESGIHSDFFEPMCHPAGETTHRMPLFTLFGHVIQWWVTVTPHSFPKNEEQRNILHPPPAAASSQMRCTMTWHTTRHLIYSLKMLHCCHL